VDWLKIGSALLLIAMLFMILPGARKAAENSPKGSMQDWMGYILPLGVVILFVILLIAMV
jgi:membrane protein insertase Oxa1/YidC/SpoIIIJ